MSGPYRLGTSVHLTGVFKDKDGDLFDPDPLALRIRLPDGTEVSFSYGVDVALVRDGLGVFSRWYKPLTPGIHRYRFVGSADDVDDADEKAFTVLASDFTTP